MLLKPTESTLMKQAANFNLMSLAQVAICKTELMTLSEESHPNHNKGKGLISELITQIKTKKITS